MNIYFLGPSGSFSEIAVREYYSQDNLFIPLSSFPEILEKVLIDINNVGALVIENSISSSVHQNIDLIFKHKNVYIIGEMVMKIQMNLMGIQDSILRNITDVYSYPQALSQCSNYINNNNLIAHESNSTSEAAEYITEKKDVTIAAIGSILLSEKYKLNILKSDIANEPQNFSRWIFISSKPLENRKSNKVTYIFKVKHEPGSLVTVLNLIAAKNGNLTKIESRPLPGTNWEYGFWIDVEIPLGSKKIFDELMKEATFECRIVGGYTKGSLLI